MRRDVTLTRVVRRGAPLFLALLAAVVVATPLAAQGYRARMSREIADRIAHRVEASSEIIVSTTIDADVLASRYGATLKKRIQGGAVLEATGGQVDALTQDPDVTHVAANSIVYRMMAVTTVVTGADQVWAGLDHVRGITGRGVGVAVIDSGVFPHPALRDRIVVSVDFTDSPANVKARDQYGHGTHVAGIIAESNADGYSGMAPGASIVNLKALSDDGSG
jgi:serine protease AprX